MSGGTKSFLGVLEVARRGYQHVDPQVPGHAMEELPRRRLNAALEHLQVPVPEKRAVELHPRHQQLWLVLCHEDDLYDLENARHVGGCWGC